MKFFVLPSSVTKGGGGGTSKSINEMMGMMYTTIALFQVLHFSTTHALMVPPSPLIAKSKAFVPSFHRASFCPPTSSTTTTSTTIPFISALSSTTNNEATTPLPNDSVALKPGDVIYLIGPGFLQLVIAKNAKAAGLRPIIIASQDKLDSFAKIVDDESLMKDASIGIPDPGDDFYGEIKGIVFCAEDAVLQPSIISTVLDWKDQSIYAPSSTSNSGVQRVVACAPIATRKGSSTKKDNKSMGWMPIFNNDKGEEKIWKDFIEAYKLHPKYIGNEGSLVLYGSLLGGGTDGIDELSDIGLDEQFYKMSLENYRDLKERSFDRYRLGAQVIIGDAVNPIPPNQEKMEKEAIKKGEELEAFRVVGGYPEQDRSNRHTVAQAVVQSLLRPTATTDSAGSVPKEMTVLSKAISKIPTAEEWDVMFANPGPADWPDPYEFKPSEFGFEKKKE